MIIHHVPSLPIYAHNQYTHMHMESSQQAIHQNTYESKSHVKSLLYQLRFKSRFMNSAHEAVHGYSVVMLSTVSIVILTLILTG